MKIAYLMNGVIGGLSGKNCVPNDIDLRPLIVEYTSKTHKFLRKDNVEIDYFIFSWEPQLQEVYNEFYAPKLMEVSDQVHFEMKSHLKSQENNPRVQAHYSRWYGANQVMKLCNDYSVKTNTHYDLVVNGRLDLCFHKQMHLDKLDSNKFHISEYNDLTNYSWPKSNEMPDHLFASNVTNMNRFYELYHKLDEYTMPGQCPQWNVISNHFLVVWHLRKLNLLNEKIISKSFINSFNKCNPEADYHIFRYENLNSEQLKSRVYEL